MKIHPLTLREELLHSFEVRTSSRSKWRPASQRIVMSLWTRTKTIRGKKKRVQKFKKQRKWRKVLLTSKFPFTQVRIDHDNFLIYKFKRPVKNFSLSRLLSWSPYVPTNPVLVYVNRVRAWAAHEGLSVGGFPLMPYQVVLKQVAKAHNPLSGMEEGDEIEGYYSYQQGFIKTFGLGQVWAGDRQSDELNVYVAIYTQTGWREYRNELPRFFVRHVLVKREDLGEEDLGFNLETKEGRQVVLDYVLENDKLFQRDQSGALLMAPLGIVGWGYGD